MNIIIHPALGGDSIAVNAGEHQGNQVLNVLSRYIHVPAHRTPATIEVFGPDLLVQLTYTDSVRTDTMEWVLDTSRIILIERSMRQVFPAEYNIIETQQFVTQKR